MATRRLRLVSRLVPSLLAMLSLCATPLWADHPATTAKVAVDYEQQLAQHPTVADLVSYAYQGSPLIKAARAEWRAAVERYRVDTALDDPEVMLEGMYMTEQEFDPVRPGDWKVTLTQPLPLPGRLAKAGQVATTEAAIARLQLDSAVRDTTLRIRESVHELYYLREARRLAAANRDLIARLAKVGGAASASSRAALIDTMKVQAQAGQVGYDLLLLAESERTEQTRLNSILNRAAEAPLGPVDPGPMRPVTTPLEQIYALAEANLEEIRLSRAAVDKARAMVDLTRYDNLPRLALGLSYGDVNQARQVGVQAGLALPLWAGKRHGRMGEARAEVERLQAMAALQVNDTRAAVRDLYFRLQNSERLILLYRDDLIPQADRAMEIAENWFANSDGTLADYTETVSVWYNFHLALARAVADNGKFLARLESLAGRTLTEGAPLVKMTTPEGAQP
jgi:outer membrane protein TolC